MIDALIYAVRSIEGEHGSGKQQQQQQPQPQQQQQQQEQEDKEYLWIHCSHKGKQLKKKQVFTIYNQQNHRDPGVWWFFMGVFSPLAAFSKLASHRWRQVSVTSTACKRHGVEVSTAILVAQTDGWVQGMGESSPVMVRYYSHIFRGFWIGEVGFGNSMGPKRSHVLGGSLQIPLKWW